MPDAGPGPYHPHDVRFLGHPEVCNLCGVVLNPGDKAVEVPQTAGRPVYLCMNNVSICRDRWRGQIAVQRQVLTLFGLGGED